MRAVALSIVALMLVACSEKPQQTGGNNHAPAWDGAKDAFMVPGWTPGDRASWQAQVDARALNQNEFRRIGTTR